MDKEIKNKNRSRSLLSGKRKAVIKILRMKDYDADKVIPKLEKKQRSGKRLKRKELLPVLLTSLMDGSMIQETRMQRNFEILQKSRAM
ncbi:MAG: hypothetical protein HFG72_09840 [Hungatella sp.]|nr:hypothetical protein [Hungatella sp.]